MRVFVAGIGSGRPPGKGMNSFYAMKTQEGDVRTAILDKPGIHARREAGSTFENNTKYDALLLQDLDMLHPQDMLEKMRAHDVDMVSAHYFRRRTDPMISVVQIEREGWPYIPLVDIPTEGLHEIASTGMGAVLIKREVYEAVRDSLPAGDHPFSEHPLPFLTGDHGHFGQDVAFFTLARRLGYKLWLDASIECAHGHTVWLTKALYDKLGHAEQQQRNWDILFQVSREKNGMDAKSAKIRIEQLQMMRNTVHKELLETQKRANELKTRLVVIDGQIAEREVDMLPAPEGATRVPLPTLGSQEAVEQAIANRHKSPYGHESAEDVLNDKERWEKKRALEAASISELTKEVRQEDDGGDAG